MSHFKRITEDNGKIKIGKVIFDKINQEVFFNDISINVERSKLILDDIKKNDFTLEVILSNLLFNDNFFMEIKDSNLNKSLLYNLRVKYFQKYNEIIDNDIIGLGLEDKILNLIRKVKEYYVPPTSKPTGDDCKKDISKINSLMSICRFLSQTDKYNSVVNLVPELDSIKKIIFTKESEIIRMNSSNSYSMVY